EHRASAASVVEHVDLAGEQRDARNCESRREKGPPARSLVMAGPERNTWRRFSRRTGDCLARARPSWSVLGVDAPEFVLLCVDRPAWTSSHRRNHRAGLRVSIRSPRAFAAIQPRAAQDGRIVLALHGRGLDLAFSVAGFGLIQWKLGTVSNFQ